MLIYVESSIRVFPLWRITCFQYGFDNLAASLSKLLADCLPAQVSSPCKTLLMLS